MRLFDLFGAARELRAKLEALEAEVGRLRTENARLEGLLDGLPGSDPDAGLTGASDPRLYRSITASANRDYGRDFPPAKRAEIQRLSHMTYALRGDAHNLLEIILDYVLGDDGMEPKAVDPDNEKLQEVLDDIWHGAPNNLHRKQWEAVLSLLLDGERFVSAEMLEGGILRLGWLPPETVEEVVWDGEGKDRYLVVRDPENPGETLRYFVLDHYEPETVEIRRIEGGTRGARYRVTFRALDGEGREQSENQEVHGLAFAWFFGRPEGAKRGRPILTPVLDYVDVHDELIWATVEREKLLSRYLIDVTSDSVSTPADAKKLLKDLGLQAPPKGPKVTAHNSSVQIDFKSPDSKAQPMATMEQVLGMNIYGALGFPQHFRGDGGDTNLATAQAQESVPLKRLRRLQGEIAEMFRRMVEVSLRLRIAAGGASVSDEDLDFRMEVEEVGGKDRRGVATMARDVASAITTAVSQGLLTKEAANAVLVQTLRGGGYEIRDEWAGLPEEEGPDALSKIADRLADRDGEPPAGDDEDEADADAA